MTHSWICSAGVFSDGAVKGAAAEEGERQLLLGLSSWRSISAAAQWFWKGFIPLLALKNCPGGGKICLRLVGGFVGPVRECWEKAKIPKVLSRDTTENRDGSGVVSPAATSGSHPACCTVSSLLRLAGHPWIPPRSSFPWRS